MSISVVALLRATVAGLDRAASLTNNRAAYDISPVWSPAGMKIFFKSDRGGERFAYKP